MKTVFLNVCVLVAASLIFAQDEPDKPAGATQGTYEVSPASGGPCTDEFFPPRLCATEAATDFGMVATGSPEATLAAVDILERGGNAIDAAVAAAFMMGVVDSDSSGIGGMTHIVIHLANGRTFAIDGTSNSPLVLDYENFRRLKESGRTYGYETIGVPTTLASLEFARKRYGTMSLATLLEPAIDTAEKGFPLSRIQIVWSRHYYKKSWIRPSTCDTSSWKTGAQSEIFVM